jgi:5'-3' exonuclease
VVLRIDGDSVAYRAAASCEPTKTKPYLEDEREALFRVQTMMNTILLSCATEDHIMYFSCSAQDNYRYKVDPNYKSKRRTIPKPTHYSATVDFLFASFQCNLCFGYEADDGIGINFAPNDVVVANDKDLLQIAGMHYNFVKEEFQEITEYMGHYQLWHQMLEGDYSDSIVGVHKIGKVKAQKLLMGCTPEEMRDTVLHLYDDEQRFHKNFKLLKILRSEEEYEAICRDLESETLNSFEKSSLSSSQDSVLSAESS